MRNFVDSIFGPVSQFLGQIKSNLLRFAVERNRPIDLDSFFAPFATLGPTWVVLIKSIMVSLFAVTLLWVAISLRGAYLYFKDGVKWW
ncbi:hypothetical protein [Brevibacillus formosus]|uniref:hypothetical protein n=1 Tax=Brevibacillus formosus TaxID=54913 RepID=UPI003F1A68E6